MYSYESAILSTTTLSLPPVRDDETSVKSLTTDTTAARPGAGRVRNEAYKMRVMDVFSRMIDELERVDEEFDNGSSNVGVGPIRTGASRGCDRVNAMMSEGTRGDDVKASPTLSSSASSTRTRTTSPTPYLSASRSIVRRGR